jgi:hypothetical protein
MKAGEGCRVSAVNDQATFAAPGRKAPWTRDAFRGVNDSVFNDLAARVLDVSVHESSCRPMRLVANRQPDAVL